METEVDKILRSYYVPRNTHKWEDYEFGKRLLEDAGIYDLQAIRALADWVGV